MCILYITQQVPKATNCLLPQLNVNEKNGVGTK